MRLFNLFEKIVQNKDELTSELQKMGFDQIKTQGNEVSVLTASDANKRKAVLKKVDQEIDNAKYNPSTLRSSIGHVDVDYPDSKKMGFVTAKPLNRQGDSSAGVSNELALANQISKALAIANPITVTFNAPNKQKTVKNVSGVVVKGRQTTNKSKTDVALITSRKNFNISIKQNNAEYWESADSYEPAKAVAKKLIDKLVAQNKVKLINQGTHYQLIPSIAFPASDEEKTQMVFGSDILGSGAIIIQTFTEDDFEWDDARSTLKINVSEIIDSVKDITGNNDVWFIVRNDSNRNTKGFYPGLRILACKPERLTEGVMLVDQSGKIIRKVDPKTIENLIRRAKIKNNRI